MSYSFVELREDVRQLASDMAGLVAGTLSHVGRIVAQGVTSDAAATNLSAQATHVVVLTKAFTGLTSSKTYKLEAEGMCSIRIPSPPGTGSTTLYQVGLQANGTVMQRSLAEVPTTWQAVPCNGYWSITGVTSFDLEMTAYSYAGGTGVGRVYYRNMVWTLREA